MKITFHGAAETVTGSCHLIETSSSKFLLDCGMFQGKFERENYQFKFDPKDIDFVILSHAHLDHCGRLPLLVKKGFRGKIFATSGTIDLSRLILMDAAQVLEESTITINRKRVRAGLKPIELLFNLNDVFEVFNHFKPIPYHEWIRVKDVKFRLHDAGHILCSEFIELEIEGKRVIFSGDIGNKGKPIIPDPEMPCKADLVMIETTYGNREHKSIKDSVIELKEAITSTFERGGVVLIPTFALERAQDILYFLKQMYENGELPECRVFLDSPLAISITKTFKRHKECFDKNEPFVNDPFNIPYLRFTRTPEESKKINDITENAIIIAGNGMCTGGRILHHLKHHIWSEKNSIVFIGYQAEGTTGREIVEGKKRIRVFGEPIAVKSRVYTINGFSSHAGQHQLLDWLKHTIKEETKVILVHGEINSMKAFSEKVKENFKVIPKIPKLYETITFS